MSMNDDYRAKYLRMLIDKVQADHYPSTTDMDLIERSIPPAWLPVYLEVLLAKVADEEHPSTSMLKRIGRVVERVRASG